MTIGDFGLNVGNSTSGKLISAFFGNSVAYLPAEPNALLDVPPEQMEAMSYESIIDTRDANSLDSSYGAMIDLEPLHRLLARDGAAHRPSRRR